MEHNLTWTKGTFDSNYQLFNNGQFSSSLLFNSWKNEAQAFGTEQSYHFITEGFSNPSTKIYNNSNELIGVISYQFWQTKATISLKSAEQFAFNFSSNWYNSWTITNFKDKQVVYNASSTSGFVRSNTDDELMILTGLFIKEYYTRILVLIMFIVIFLPIISSSWH